MKDAWEIILEVNNETHGFQVNVPYAGVGHVKYDHHSILSGVQVPFVCTIHKEFVHDVDDFVNALIDFAADMDHISAEFVLAAPVKTSTRIKLFRKVAIKKRGAN